MSDEDLQGLVRRRLWELARTPEEASRLSRWAVPAETIAVVTHRGVINALRLSVGDPDTVTPAFGNAAIHELVLADGRLRAVDEPG